MSILKVDAIQSRGSSESAITFNGGLLLPRSVAMQVNSSDTDQSVGASNTKIQWENVEIDTISGWDSTNHRYTPDVAGYYLVGGGLRLGVGTVNSYINVQIKRNGSDLVDDVIEAQYQVTSDLLTNGVYTCGTGLMLLNGSSDYIEMWVDGDEAMTAHDISSQKSHFFAQLVHAT